MKKGILICLVLGFLSAGVLRAQEQSPTDTDILQTKARIGEVAIQRDISRNQTAQYEQAFAQLVNFLQEQLKRQQQAAKLAQEEAERKAAEEIKEHTQKDTEIKELKEKSDAETGLN